MAGSPLHDSVQPSVNGRLVWALRVASLLCLLASLALTVLFVLAPKVPLPYWTSVISLVLYPAVLWGLRTTPPKRLALGLAVALGSVWFVVFGNYASLFNATLIRPEPFQHLSADILLLLGGSLSVLTLLQGAYVGVALKVHRSMTSGRGGLPRLVGAIGGGLLWGVLVIIAVGFYAMGQPGQAAAVSMLRTLNTAQITYHATYGDSYPSSLAELGPPPRGMQESRSAAGIIDSALASGTKRSRTYRVVDDIVDEIDSALGREPKHAYRFDYQPGPRDEHGRINSYTICVRPIGRGGGGNSYFTDETGVIRYTSEDRCPTVKDSPLAG